MMATATPAAGSVRRLPPPDAFPPPPPVARGPKVEEVLDLTVDSDDSDVVEIIDSSSTFAAVGPSSSSSSDANARPRKRPRPSSPPSPTSSSLRAASSPCTAPSNAGGGPGVHRDGFAPTTASSSAGANEPAAEVKNETQDGLCRSDDVFECEGCGLEFDTEEEAVQHEIMCLNLDDDDDNNNDDVDNDGEGKEKEGKCERTRDGDEGAASKEKRGFSPRSPSDGGGRAREAVEGCDERDGLLHWSQDGDGIRPAPEGLLDYMKNVPFDGYVSHNFCENGDGEDDEEEYGYFPTVMRMIPPGTAGNCNASGDDVGLERRAGGVLQRATSGRRTEEKEKEEGSEALDAAVEAKRDCAAAERASDENGDDRFRSGSNRGEGERKDEGGATDEVPSEEKKDEDRPMREEEERRNGPVAPVTEEANRSSAGSSYEDPSEMAASAGGPAEDGGAGRPGESPAMETGAANVFVGTEEVRSDGAIDRERGPIGETPDAPMSEEYEDRSRKRRRSESSNDDYVDDCNLTDLEEEMLDDEEDDPMEPEDATETKEDGEPSFAAELGSITETEAANAIVVEAEGPRPGGETDKDDNDDELHDELFGEKLNDPIIEKCGRDGSRTRDDSSTIAAGDVRGLGKANGEEAMPNEGDVSIEPPDGAAKTNEDEDYLVSAELTHAGGSKEDDSREDDSRESPDGSMGVAAGETNEVIEIVDSEEDSDSDDEPIGKSYRATLQKRVRGSRTDGGDSGPANGAEPSDAAARRPDSDPEKQADVCVGSATEGPGESEAAAYNGARGATIGNDAGSDGDEDEEPIGARYRALLPERREDKTHDSGDGNVGREAPIDEKGADRASARSSDLRVGDDATNVPGNEKPGDAARSGETNDPTGVSEPPLEPISLAEVSGVKARKSEAAAAHSERREDAGSKLPRDVGRPSGSPSPLPQWTCGRCRRANLTTLTSCAVCAGEKVGPTKSKDGVGPDAPDSSVASRVRPASDPKKWATLYTGVSYNQSKRKYKAQFKNMGNQVFAGYHDLAADAARARDEKLRNVKGEVGHINFASKEQYLQARREEASERGTDIGDGILRSFKALRQEKWDRMFAELVSYKKTVGHTRVPSHYSENPSLGNWVGVQRKQYKRRVQAGDEGAISKERIDRLDAVGFAWQPGKGTTGAERRERDVVADAIEDAGKRKPPLGKGSSGAKCVANEFAPPHPTEPPPPVMPRAMPQGGTPEMMPQGGTTTTGVAIPGMISGIPSQEMMGTGRAIPTQHHQQQQLNMTLAQIMAMQQQLRWQKQNMWAAMQQQQQWNQMLQFQQSVGQQQHVMAPMMAMQQQHIMQQGSGGQHQITMAKAMEMQQQQHQFSNAIPNMNRPMENRAKERRHELSNKEVATPDASARNRGPEPTLASSDEGTEVCEGRERSVGCKTAEKGASGRADWTCGQCASINPPFATSCANCVTHESDGHAPFNEGRPEQVQAVSAQESIDSNSDVQQDLAPDKGSSKDKNETMCVKESAATDSARAIHSDDNRSDRLQVDPAQASIDSNSNVHDYKTLCAEERLGNKIDSDSEVEHAIKEGKRQTVEKTKTKPRHNPCPHCNKVFKTKTGLKYHLDHKECKVEDLRQNEDNLRASSETARVKSTAGNQDKKESKNDKTRNEKNFSCPDCGKHFLTKAGFTSHYAHRVCQLKEKGIACPRCKTEFTRKDTLKRHMNRKICWPSDPLTKESRNPKKRKDDLSSSDTAPAQPADSTNTSAKTAPPLKAFCRSKSRADRAERRTYDHPPEVGQGSGMHAAHCFFNEKAAQEEQERLFAEAARRQRERKAQSSARPSAPAARTAPSTSRVRSEGPVFVRPIENLALLHEDHWRWSDFHSRLGLHRGATVGEVKKQFRRLALILHPDKSDKEDAQERFHAVKEAYERLMATSGRI